MALPLARQQLVQGFQPWTNLSHDWQRWKARACRETPFSLRATSPYGKPPKGHMTIVGGARGTAEQCKRYASYLPCSSLTLKQSKKQRVGFFLHTAHTPLSIWTSKRQYHSARTHSMQEHARKGQSGTSERWCLGRGLGVGQSLGTIPRV